MYSESVDTDRKNEKREGEDMQNMNQTEDTAVIKCVKFGVESKYCCGDYLFSTAYFLCWFHCFYFGF